MIKIILGLLIAGMIVLSFGCLGEPDHQNNESLNKQYSTSDIYEEIVEYLLYHITNAIKSGNADTNSTFVLYFTQKNLFYDTNTIDPILYISTLFCEDQSFYNGYKGVIRLSDYTVAIFDDTSLGSLFYDPKEIIDTPFIYLKCQSGAMRPLLSFKYSKNKLFPLCSASQHAMEQNTDLQ